MSAGAAAVPAAALAAAVPAAAGGVVSSGQENWFRGTLFKEVLLDL